MKKTTKIILSIIVPVILVASLALGLIFGIKKDTTQLVDPTTQEQQAKYNIPGVYYASEQEDSGASSAPLTAKAGSIYVGSNSTFTFSQGAIRSHSAEYGGAIYVANGGTFTMNGGAIAYNQAKWGGAIYVEAGGTCRLLGGTITGNASEEATAVYVEDGATLVVDGCNIVNNYTQLYGNYIDFYVDGNPISVSIGNKTTFNLADAPLDYEHCCGYFIDETLMTGVEDGASLGTVVQSAVATGEPGEIYNLYTKTATPSKITFTLNSGDADYNVKQIDTTTTTGVVVIPRQYNGKNVTSIFSASSSSQGAFYNNNNITAVYMPNTLTSIGNHAFRKSSANATLKTVTIPNSVTSIGSNAFYYCRGLTSVVIPDSVTSIGGSAFQYCSNLMEVCNLSALNIVAGSNSNGAVARYACLVTNDPSELGGQQVQSNNVRYYVNTKVSPNVKAAIGLVDTTVTSVVLDNDCKVINVGAFESNTKITSITIPSSVTSIGSNAFYYCRGLTSVVIPDSVTSIGSGAFDSCTGLTSVTIPDSVTTINQYAFYGCTGLTSITIPSRVTSIGERTFRNCTGLTSVTIDSSTIAELSSSDSDLLTNATTVYVKDTITSVGTYITGSFTQTTSDKAGYNKYVKNS